MNDDQALPTVGLTLTVATKARAPELTSGITKYADYVVAKPSRKAGSE
jgi:hypothetical protein